MNYELTVTDKDIQFAKKQVEEFKKTPKGQWRYTDVEAWRGVVCEMLCSGWLKENFKVDKEAKGLDTSGIYDECDLIINMKKVEIKSATKNYFRYVMPKKKLVDNKPKDFYIVAKYNEEVEPNKVIIVGYLTKDIITKHPVKKNKGAPYYEVPLTQCLKINKDLFN